MTALRAPTPPASARTADGPVVTRRSVTLCDSTDAALRKHLLRTDGQEDICLATYRTSTGSTRLSAVLREVEPPQPGDRLVHGNATITAEYIMRVAARAADNRDGVVMLHSHPRGSGWQTMSRPDHDAESSYANLVREITGLPLVGMTLAGRDLTWSARHWDNGVGGKIQPSHSENVRVIGDQLRMSWNDELVPPPPPRKSQIRTITCWGPRLHADLTRRSVMVVGLGSVGLDIAVRLAAAGITRLGLMDFDTVKEHNLDRLIGADPTDAVLRRGKVDLAHRLAAANATAAAPMIECFDLSVCEPDGLAAALDYDQIISCVDRPWPRAVLNATAYRDLIPVIDGGIAVDVFPGADAGMRNATWRSHVLRPGRPCMACNHQLDLGAVAADMSGALDDPVYIAGTSTSDATNSANVALLSINAAATILTQYISLNIAPGGLGDPGPLQYILSAHTLEHLPTASRPACPVEALTGLGDSAPRLTAAHHAADEERRSRDTSNLDLRHRSMRHVDNLLRWATRRLGAHIRCRRTVARRRTRRAGTDRKRRRGRGDRG